MITFEIPPSLLDKAKLVSSKLNLQFSTPRIHAYGNAVPTLGELVVSEYLGVPITSTYQYDMELPDGRKLDVKTKFIRAAPRQDFNVAVSNVKRQDCDIYAFVFIKNDNTKAWLPGYLTSTDFYAKAKHWKKGDTDRNLTFRQDCYTAFVHELEPMEDLLKIVVDTRKTQA